MAALILVAVACFALHTAFGLARHAAAPRVGGSPFWWPMVILAFGYASLSIVSLFFATMMLVRVMTT